MGNKSPPHLGMNSYGTVLAMIHKIGEALKTLA